MLDILMFYFESWKLKSEETQGIQKKYLIKPQMITFILFPWHVGLGGTGKVKDVGPNLEIVDSFSTRFISFSFVTHKYSCFIHKDLKMWHIDKYYSNNSTYSPNSYPL